MDIRVGDQAGDKPFIGFGRFLLDPVRRRLLLDGQPVRLQPMQFDTLLYLAENAQRVVDKDELLSTVWRGRLVEEGSLTQTMFLLRRALRAGGGEAYIVTAPGRGYRFAVDVSRAPAAPLPRDEAALSVTAFLDTGRNYTDTLPPASHTSLVRFRLAIGRKAGLLAAIAAFGIVAILVSPMIAWWHGSPPARPRLSIVVLPFRNLSNDRDKDYLADAIGDDLITDLSHMPGSLVIARATADTYRNANMPVTQIGRDLNVRYVLEGSISPDGNTFHINAQLVDAEHDGDIWTDHFDVPGGHLDDARTAIEGRIRGSLNIELTRAESVRSVHERPNNPDALDLYYRAMSLVHRNQDAMARETANKMLEKAIRLQPDFVDANVALATNITWSDTLTDETFQEAQDAISTALRLQPNNVAALSARAGFSFNFNGFADAERDAKAAVALDPNNTTALYQLALVDYATGDSKDALSALNTSLMRDPKNPKVPIWRLIMGDAYIEVGDYDRAVECLQQANASLGAFLAAKGALARLTVLSLISASSLAGRTAFAHSLYQSFRTQYPDLTIWGITSGFAKPHPLSNRFGPFYTGLRMAGMPDFSDEHRGPAPNVKMTDQLNSVDPQAPPLILPGAKTIDTQQMKGMLAHDPGLLAFDTGRGVAVPEHVQWVWSIKDVYVDGSEAPAVALVETDTQGRKTTPVIIVGDGSFDVFSYGVADSLVKAGYSQIFWYRGGEQSWTQAGLPARDLRP